MPVCRVLVLEDNDGLRELLGDVFGDEGYRFALTSSSEEFSAALAAGDVDVAVIDVVTPGREDGFALAQRAADCGCGVILVSGHGDKFDEVERSGHFFMLKPFRVASLLSVIDEALAAARRRCAVRERRYGT